MLQWSLMSVKVDQCVNKTVQRKSSKQCTFSPADPKTIMELNCMWGNENG